MSAAALGLTFLAILAIFGLIAVVVSFADGLAPFGPRSTGHMVASAQSFCTGDCRTADGRCPLTGKTEPVATCPLWRYVEADVTTAPHGSPFEHLQTT